MKLYNSDDRLKFGLKRARKKAPLLQKELVEKLNELDDEKMHVILKTVQNWEQGVSKPNLDTLLKLCDFYHCDLDYLVGRIDEKTHDLQFICDYTGLSAESINLLHEWHTSSDNRKLWSGYLNTIMNDNRFYELMTEINDLMGSAKFEGYAEMKGFPEDAIQEIDIQKIRLWNIEHIFTNILNEMSYDHRMNIIAKLKEGE